MKDTSQSIEILVMEDNPGDYLLVEDYLFEKFNAPKIKHCKSFSASAELAEENAAFSVILLDLVLPDLEKEELVEKVQGIFKETPIVVLTGYTDLNLARSFIAKGVSDFLIKDEINPELLYRTIIYAIERKNFVMGLAKAVIKTQENERYEIGSELHDNVCQILAVSTMYLSVLQQSLPAEMIPFFDQCNQHINSALAEIRNLSHRLAPAFFDDSTFEESLRGLFGTFTLKGAIEIILRFEDSAKKYPLGLEIQLNLYRILQEQLKNIVKHSKATIVEVSVNVKNNKLKMMIADNGVGFNIDRNEEGIGLANMKRRAELFLGTFKIDSSPNKGCKVIIEIPLQQ